MPACLFLCCNDLKDACCKQRTDCSRVARVWGQSKQTAHLELPLTGARREAGAAEGPPARLWLTSQSLVTLGAPATIRPLSRAGPAPARAVDCPGREARGWGGSGHWEVSPPGQLILSCQRHQWSLSLRGGYPGHPSASFGAPPWGTIKCAPSIFPHLFFKSRRHDVPCILKGPCPP